MLGNSLNDQMSLMGYIDPFAVENESSGPSGVLYRGINKLPAQPVVMIIC